MKPGKRSLMSDTSAEAFVEVRAAVERDCRMLPRDCHVDAGTETHAVGHFECALGKRRHRSRQRIEERRFVPLMLEPQHRGGGRACMNAGDVRNGSRGVMRCDVDTMRRAYVRDVEHP